MGKIVPARKRQPGEINNLGVVVELLALIGVVDSCLLLLLVVLKQRRHVAGLAAGLLHVEAPAVVLQGVALPAVEVAAAVAVVAAVAVAVVVRW